MGTYLLKKYKHQFYCSRPNPYSGIPVKAIFVPIFYIRWAREVTRPSTTHNQSNKHQDYGGGAAHPSNGVDDESMPPEGWAALRMLFPRLPSKQFCRFYKLKWVAVKIHLSSLDQI